ncbi:MAG TPA: hemin-degrading factor [Candidatus Aquabacterium excrementipullorum]|nr:hemin-degrading factor [Candidatus Aquabacterium excrementipullorum]
MSASTTTPHASLRQQFAALRHQGLRTRDAAHKLGVSEGEAMVAHAASHMHPAEEASSLYSVTVLAGDWIALLQGLEAVGPVMALTRNESVVHEKIGVYRNVSAQGPVGLALGAEIDLRLFLMHWHVGMHVVERTAKGEQHSLQFFDVHGQAVHKVHAREQSDLQALEQLVQRHARPEARPLFKPGQAQTQPDRPDAEIDVSALDQAWSAMKDTHEFFSLLKTHQVARVQSFRLMEGRHTRRTPLVAVEWLLQRASRRGLPIMVFAGNAGCLQIHTGAVHRIETMGPWLNVLDDGFNLHLRADQVAESWLVSKPTDDGVVTSLELFDAQGQVIAMFFGERKPGKPELPGWRTLAHGLMQADEPSLEVAA